MKKMIKIIDTFIAAKEIDLKDMVVTLIEFKQQAIKWIIKNKYDTKYKVRPSFKVIDRDLGKVEYKLEVLEIIEDK